MITQKGWRITGAICITISAVMAYFGVRDITSMTFSVPQLLVYWGIFLLLLCVALYIVVLDMRYIKMKFAMERREVFQQTIGEEEFRKQILQAHQSLKNSEDNTQ